MSQRTPQNPASAADADALWGDRDEPAHRADRAAMAVVAVLAILIAGFAAVSGAVSAVQTLVDPVVALTVFVDEPFDLPAGSTLESAAFTEARVASAEVDGVARGMLVAAAVVRAMSVAIVGASIAIFLLDVARRRPFGRRLFGTAIWAGSAILFGGLLELGFRAIAGLAAVPVLQEGTDVPLVAGFETDFAFLGGIVIVVLGLVFRAGGRLQREAEGLV